MTANAVVNDSGHPPEPNPRQREAERVVRVIRESFAVVEPRADEVGRYFYATLFTIAPQTRDMFPANMSMQRSRLLRALVHIVQMVDRPDELTPFLRQLGRDHRKFDVIDEHFEAVGTALLAALRHYAGDAWTSEVEQAWADAYATIAGAMKDGAAADQGPAWWPARVVEHVRVDWDTAIIRVRPDPRVPFVPGQYVSVETPHRPRMWRYLSPANAARADDVLEFHVRSVPGGWVSGSLVRRSVVGEMWRIGAPLGNLWTNRAADRDLVMVAGGTGIAPMRAIIDELAQRDRQPKVTLFFGGRTAESLYNIEELRSRAHHNPWLTVVGVTEDGSDGEKGRLPEVVASGGAWNQHDVLVAGSPQMIRATVSKMLVTGTTFDQISYDSFASEE